jgi:hypothetical protein
MTAASDAALNSLGKLLRDPTFRTDFKANYHSALTNHNVAESDIPAKVLETLQHMGEPELQAVADLNDSLDAEHVAALTKANMV